MPWRAHIFLILTCVGVAAGAESCYVCDGAVDDNCNGIHKKTQSNRQYLQQCANGENRCLTITNSVNRTIVRECATACTVNRGDFHFTCCAENNCNYGVHWGGATVARVHLKAMVALVTAKMYI